MTSLKKKNKDEKVDGIVVSLACMLGMAGIVGVIIYIVLYGI